MMLYKKIKHILSIIWRYLIPRRGILYWNLRARKYGIRSVLNIGHSESEIAEVTAMQIREIFPYLQAQLNKTEKIILDFGCGTGRFTAKLAETIQGQAIGVDPIKYLLDKAPPPYKKSPKNTNQYT